MDDFRKRWLDLHPRETPDTRVFDFIVNEGDSMKSYEMGYDAFLENKDLRARVWDKRMYRLVLGRQVFLLDRVWLEAHKEDKELVLQYEAHQRECPLYYWAPHSDVDVAFLNDETHTVKIAQMPNRRGKTVIAMVDMLLDLVPNDPKWRMFTMYGVKPREWTGGKLCGCATYTMGHHQKTTYQEIVKWTPRKYLGTYAPTVQARKMRVEPSWNKSNPSLPLSHCQSRFGFFSYEQSQDAYEGGVWHRMLWDEQGHEHLFDAGDRGTTTVMGRHVFSLTPHKLEGRPDTGAGSWIDRMCRGEMTKGHNVKVYTGSLLDVPDWVYPESSKAKEFEKWYGEPIRTHNTKMLNEGKARLFGEPHVSAGLVYDEVQPEVHFIDPFEVDPNKYTLYRAIDHGTRNATCCLWFAVDSRGFIYIYREYYSRDKSVPQNVRAIVELSGNKLVKADKYVDPDTGDEIQRYEEIMDGEVYVKTVLDGRSFTTKESQGRPINWLYRANGLLVQKASGKQDKDRLPMVKALLEIDPERIHPITGAKGSPRMFWFSTCTETIREWRGYVWEEYTSGKVQKNPKEKPKDNDNHAMTALAYGVQIPLRFFGDTVKYEDGDKPKEETYGKPLSRITGY